MIQDAPESAHVGGVDMSMKRTFLQVALIAAAFLITLEASHGQ
jgi:hypothetical protein